MSNIRRIIESGAIVTALVTPLAMTAQAPGTWVLTPYAGAFVPSGDIGRLSLAGGGFSAAAQLKHENALALGGTASYWFADRMAVEFGGAYAFSHTIGSFQSSDPTQGNVFFSGSEAAHVTMGSAKLMFALLPTSNSTQLRFGIGPAIISRGGTAYKGDADGKIEGLTNVGGVASLCTRIPLTNMLALRIRAENYMYQSQLKWRAYADPSSNMNFDRRFQNDFIFSGGLQIHFNP